MPWCAKAQELVRQQYTAVGAAAQSALAETITTLELAASRGADVGKLLNNYQSRSEMVDRYVKAYQQ